MSSRRIFISSIGYVAIKSNEVEPDNGSFAVAFKAIHGAMVIGDGDQVFDFDTQVKNQRPAPVTISRFFAAC